MTETLARPSFRLEVRARLKEGVHIERSPRHVRDILCWKADRRQQARSPRL
jgi:hypothetical protein